MKYTKPVVIAFGSAAVAIQSSTAKVNHRFPDGINMPATTTAYEADE